MNKKRAKLTEDEIDEIVTPEADGGSASEKPIRILGLKGRIDSLGQERVGRLPLASDHEILSGETVFSGTRVPVAALFDNLDAGLTLDEFLDNFPTVTRGQAIQVIAMTSNKRKA